MANEYRYFSLLHDADVVRLSVANDHGDEYFAIVVDGAGYGDRRDVALEKIAAAIEMEQPAGEVFPFRDLATSRGARHANR